MRSVTHSRWKPKSTRNRGATRVTACTRFFVTCSRLHLQTHTVFHVVPREYASKLSSPMFDSPRQQPPRRPTQGRDKPTGKGPGWGKQGKAAVVREA